MAERPVGPRWWIGYTTRILLTDTVAVWVAAVSYTHLTLPTILRV